METTAHLQILPITAALGVFFVMMIGGLLASNYSLIARRVSARKRADLS